MEKSTADNCLECEDRDSKLLDSGAHGANLQHDVQLYGEGIHVLAEAWPLVAILKPKGLAINGRTKEKDCIIHRLTRKYSGKWSALRRFWLPVRTYGIVLCTTEPNLAAVEEATRNAPLELCFDAVLYVESAELVLEEKIVALPSIGSNAVLCKLEEAGRLAHILATVTLSESDASISEVADALIDALARSDCPLVGSLRGCRRLKGRILMKNERALSVVHISCYGFDINIPLDSRLDQLMAHERSFAIAEETQNEKHMAALIEILTGPKAIDHCAYAPELQQLGIRRLGRTSEVARKALDALGLMEPRDMTWVTYASAQLEKYVLEQWHADPRARERLQYGIHVTRLLCCFVRVRREGLPSVEWLTQGTRLDSDPQEVLMAAPLRATELCFDRSNHCELIALNKAYTLCFEHSTDGAGCFVDLIVAQQPCVSCAAAMCNFSSRLPLVQLRVGFRDWGSIQRALNAKVRDVG